MHAKQAEISLVLPEALEVQLVDDWEALTRDQRVRPLSVVALTSQPISLSLLARVPSFPQPPTAPLPSPP